MQLSSLFGFRSWLCRMCKKIPMLYWREMMLTNGFSIFYWLFCCTWNLELFVRKNVRELQFQGIWKWWKAIRILKACLCDFVCPGLLCLIMSVCWMIVWCEGIRLVKMEVPRKTKLIVSATAYVFFIVVTIMVSRI
jgi:hypothetical protein